MYNSGSHCGDRRLDPAERFFHDHLVKVGPRGVSVRGVGGHRAGEVRLGRFLRTEKVTVNKIVDKAAMTTSGRVDGLPIRALPDPTSCRDDGSGNGLVGPATIAVEAEPGTLLGAVDMQLIERSGGGPKPPASRQGKPPRAGSHANKRHRSERSGACHGGRRSGSGHLRDGRRPPGRRGCTDPGIP